MGKQQIKNIKNYGSANHDKGKQGASSLPSPSGVEAFLSEFFADGVAGPLQVCKYAGIKLVFCHSKDDLW